MKAKQMLAIGIAAVLALVIYGAYLYPQAVENGVGAAGSTFNTAYTAAVSADLTAAGSTGTSTSVLNSDSNTRYVTGFRAACDSIGNSLGPTGAGFASFTVTVGTSTAASPASFDPWARVAQATIATTTSGTTRWVFASSTTQTGTSSLPAIWHSGKYMTFYTNATNTAQCTFGVDYLKS